MLRTNHEIRTGPFRFTMAECDCPKPDCEVYFLLAQLADDDGVLWLTIGLGGFHEVLRQIAQLARNETVDGATPADLIAGGMLNVGLPMDVLSRGWGMCVQQMCAWDSLSGGGEIAPDGSWSLEDLWRSPFPEEDA